MNHRNVSATIAITGMNATDNPAPGVALARSLRQEPGFSGRVIGLGYDALDPGFYARGLLDGGAILPYPSAGREALLERVLFLRECHGIDVLLPSLDSELRAAASLEPELLSHGVRMLVPRIDTLDRVCKAHLTKLGQDLGLSVPTSETVQSPTDVIRGSVELGFPLVVKGPYYGAEIVHTQAEAVAAFHRFVAVWGLPVVLQKYVVGEEYNIAALGDGTGRLVGAVAMRKMAITDKGKGWSGVTLANPDLLRVARRIVEGTRFRGGLEVELLRERGTGKLHIIEINPRFPAWVYLCAAAGQNLPYHCVELALGHDVPTPLPPYRVGTMFVRISLDQVSDMTTYERLASQGHVVPENGRAA